MTRGKTFASGAGALASHDGGLVHDRDRLHPFETRLLHPPDPRPHGHRPLLEAEEVPTGVLGDAPPPGRALAYQQAQLGSDDLPVAGLAAAAEHHVADDEASAGPEPAVHGADERRLVLVAEV